MQMTTYQKAAYRKIEVETANPGRILLTLYDAAIKFVGRAKQQIEDGDIPGKGVSISKAHAIIAEFINALDFQQAPDLCRNLEQIYTFMLDQLSEANHTMTTAPLEPALRHLQELKETWAKAVAQAAAQAPPGA